MKLTKPEKAQATAPILAVHSEMPMYLRYPRINKAVTISFAKVVMAVICGIQTRGKRIITVTNGSNKP